MMTEVDNFTLACHGNRCNSTGELKCLSYRNVFLQLQCWVPRHHSPTPTNPLVFNNRENALFPGQRVAASCLADDSNWGKAAGGFSYRTRAPHTCLGFCELDSNLILYYEH